MLPALSFAILALVPRQIEASISTRDQVVIPAERVGNYLRVDAKVNGKPVRLIVDTGAGLNVLTWEAAKRLGIEGGLDIKASGAGSSQAPAKMVTLNEFRIGDALVKGDAAVILALPEILRCDGLVGYSFFRHFATTFDYDANTLTVRNSGTYKPTSEEIAGDLRVRNNHPQVSGQIAGEKGWMLIDTGNNGTTSILKWLVSKQDLVKKWPTSSERVVGKGVGGEVKGYISVSPGFDISGVSIPQGQVTLDSSGAGAFADPDILANVGAEHLRRFRFTIDYNAKKAFFGKSKAYSSPLQVDRSGLRVEPKEGKETVIIVVKDSPGDLAGIKVGDVILEIDGKKATDIEPMIFTTNFRQPAGNTVRLKIEREGKVIDVSFKLEDLVK